MQPEVVKYLQDAYRACGLVQSFTANRSFEEYQADLLGFAMQCLKTASW